MKIYIAASFCYEDRAKTSQRKYLIEKTVARIKRYLKGNYYIPHQLKIPNAWDMSLEEWSKKVYEEDIKNLWNADLVIFLSFGKENNAGAVWEVGFVCGRRVMQIPNYDQDLVVVKMTNEAESLMISNYCDKIISKDEIDNYDWENRPAYKTKMEKLS